ncbi:hypothetical protein JCM33374_g6485 [Metschnikowia sp. JCM 33374]|nr:hypothetical protein JCM33374_g6485 [Metschnikowia sp. JCM 33374]
MSRNKEKAQAGLNRYYEQKIHEAGVVTADPSNRPRRVQSVSSIAEAELWRRTVVGEFSAQLAKINDPSLGDDEVRQLNEAVNRTYNEKRAWEYHILSLGGNDYIRYEQKLGTRVRGKTYFGRAKLLPEARAAEKVSLGASGQKPQLSLAYYGVFDTPQWSGSIDASRETVETEIRGALEKKGDLPGDTRYTQKDVEKWLVERRKQELLAKLMQ